MARIVTLLLLALAGVGWGQQSATERFRDLTVRNVQVTFEGDAMPEAAPALVDVAPGDIYRPEAVRRSIRQLFTLGAFSDVKVEAERVVDGGGGAVDVFFRLYPRLEVQAIQLAGLEGPALQSLDARLVNESGLAPGDPLDVDELGRAAERIATALHNEGFLWARVEPEASFQSPTAVVVFHVAAGHRAQVRTMDISGVEPHVANHVRRKLGIAAGSIFVREKLVKRVEAVTSDWRELGYYGSSIAIETTPVAPASVDLHLTAELGPRVLIEVRGGEFSEKEVRRLVPIFGETLFTADLIEEGRANLEDDLRARGYRDAEVTVTRESRADGRQLFLGFDAQPGPQYSVSSIAIEGLHSVPDAELRALLTTPTNRRFRTAPFRESVWQDDLDAIRSHLERRGFHEAEVVSEIRAAKSDPTQLALVVRIDEGPLALIGAVEITGIYELDPDEVFEVAGLTEAMPFDAIGVVEAQDRLLAHYYDQGFRDARVDLNTRWADRGTEADVSFRVTEGRRTRVDRVIVSGLVVSRESAVRQLVTVESGAPLAPNDILDTRQKLVGSGLFKRVDIDVLPADPVTNRSDVLISVAEGPRTTFAYGFGFEERQLGRAEVEVTRRNLFGLNRTASVFTRVSFRGGRFITTFRQPDSFVKNLPLFVSVFAEEEQRTSFDYNRVGVGLQISKRLNDDQNLFFRYRFDRTKVFDLLVDIDEIDRRFRNTRISSLSVASLTDQRDDPLDPTRGQFRILDVEWSSRLLGTEAPYLKGLAQQFFYIPLPRNMVVAAGFRVGIGQTLEAQETLMPIAERFFGGGATTLRGFALDHASPKQQLLVQTDDGTLIVEGDPIGGNVISIFNLELRFPILGNLTGVVFSDSGNVYPRLESMDLSDWRYNLGFGFRYDTPLGPLRVDYGFKLDRRTRFSIDCPEVTSACRESAGRFHVSLGHAF